MNWTGSNAIPGFSLGPSGFGAFPSVNLFEDRDGMIVVAELPGVEREALKMAGQGRTLTISGERRREWYPTRKSSPKKNNKSKESKKPVRDVQHSVLQDDLDVLFGYARHVGRSMSSFLHMSTSGTK